MLILSFKYKTKSMAGRLAIGSPTGIRTPVAWMKTRCPNP